MASSYVCHCHHFCVVWNSMYHHYDSVGSIASPMSVTPYRFLLPPRPVVSWFLLSTITVRRCGTLYRPSRRAGGSSLLPPMRKVPVNCIAFWCSSKILSSVVGYQSLVYIQVVQLVPTIQYLNIKFGYK